MRPDRMGFGFPALDPNKCVGCGLCTKTCPVTTPRPGNKIISVCAAQHTNTDILKASSSGGVFSALANNIFIRGGKVYGMAFDQDFRAAKIFPAETETELSRLRGSKYFQGITGNSFQQVRDDLLSGKTVLYSGTPCQIAGLKAYLGSIDAKNLYLVSIVCFGTAAPFVWQKWLDFNFGKPLEVSFRHKKYGWEKSALYVKRADGSEFIEKLDHIDYFYWFSLHLCVPEICGTCPFRNENDMADLTIGDFWGMPRTLRQRFEYPENGISAVLTRTEKGRSLFEGSSELLHTEPAFPEDVFLSNPAVKYPCRLHPDCDIFKNDFITLNTSDFIKKWKMRKENEAVYTHSRSNWFHKFFSFIHSLQADVLILSLPDQSNYGAILQRYALVLTLKKLGIAAVSYDDSEEKKPKIRLTLWKKFKLVCSGAFRKFVLRDKNAWLRPWLGDETTPYYEDCLYDQWVRSDGLSHWKKISRISLFTKDFIRANIPQTNHLDGFKAYIVGSDQVWRKLLTHGKLGMYFLDFLESGNQAKRIAYAASFGYAKPDFNKFETETCARLLQKFDAVSVREDSGIDICRNFMGVHNAVQMPDPTFLPEQKDYERFISDTPSGKEKKSLFCYILHDTLEIKRMREKIVDSLNLKINIIRFPLICENFPMPPVEEWLSGIAHADFVLTDSFHGTIFSLIFGKKFLSVGDYEFGLARVRSLLRLFELEHRLILKNEEITPELLNEQLPFDKINARLAELRKRGSDFLKKNIGMKK